MKEVFAVNSKTADSFLLFLSVIYRLIQRILLINKIIVISSIPLAVLGAFVSPICKSHYGSTDTQRLNAALRLKFSDRCIGGPYIG